jgi:hypothetical protein
MLAGLAAGIEAARPLPRVCVGRIAGANCQSADLDLAVIDVPAVGAFGVSAAGEGGRGP